MGGNSERAAHWGQSAGRCATGRRAPPRLRPLGYLPWVEQHRPEGASVNFSAAINLTGGPPEGGGSCCPSVLPPVPLTYAEEADDLGRFAGQDSGWSYSGLIPNFALSDLAVVPAVDRGFSWNRYGHDPTPGRLGWRTPMGDTHRWWRDKSREYVEWLRNESELSEGYLKRNERYLVALQRDCARAGTTPPAGPTEVTREHIRALKGCGLWGPSTLKTTFSVTRGFLRWAGNPLADERNPVWRLPSGSIDRRRWLDRNDLLALYSTATGRVRVRVVLQGFNGTRECEVRRLRVRDLDLALPQPSITIRGKGRFGGKYRTIPMDPMVRAVLEQWVRDKGPDDPVYPVSHTVADAELAALGRSAGVATRVTGHVLRRSFGRIAYEAGVPVPTIQRIYGHSSIDQTLHYIGVGQAEMVAGLAVFDTHMRAALATADLPLPTANER